jgi:hypothetical protein
MRLNVFAIQSPICRSSKCNRGGVAPIVFSPGTRWRTWGTRPVPIGFCQDSRRGRLAAVSKIDTLRGRGWEREPQVPVRLRSGQALDFAPDFLSGFVVSVNIMRLSLRKAAYVIVDENGVVGNPEFAPNEQKIKPIESISISSVHFSLNLPQASQFLGMTQVGAGADLVPRLRRSDHLRH